MNRSLVFVLSTLLSAIPAVLSAGELTPAEKTFFDRHAPDLVRFETQTMDDLALEQVFSTPFYNLTVIIMLGDGEPTAGEKPAAPPAGAAQSFRLPSRTAVPQPPRAQPHRDL